MTERKTATTSCALTTAAAVMAAVMSACHSPGGGWYPYSGGTNTYYSYENQPKSVVLVDTRSGEEFFTMDIPAGKQLTFDFVTGGGDDPVNRPDLMRWEVWDMFTYTGQLTNSLSVPNAASRRVDVHFREGPEYKQPEPGNELRTDQQEKTASR
jgi:hypothetical protein